MKDDGLAQLQKELEFQQQQLEQLQLALDATRRDHEQLSYTVSHDMQEPLRMVVNFVSLLQKRYEHLFDEKGQQYIYYAVDGAKRMQKMIEQLLTYSRINSKGDTFEPVDTNHCVDKVVESLQLDIGECGAHVEYDALPEVRADGKQILTLFTLLVSNAVEYRLDSRPLKIKITAKAKGAFWRFCVCDNGSGVASKYLPNLFDLFKRYHLDRNLEGSGMGLAYCKQIIRRHGGEIWAESNDDKGLTICFTILG